MYKETKYSFVHREKKTTSPAALLLNSRKLGYLGIDEFLVRIRKKTLLGPPLLFLLVYVQDVPEKVKKNYT